MQYRFGMFWLFLIFLGWDLHLFTLLYATQAAFSLSRRSAGQDRKNAGDVMGHKCPGMFDIAYWCVFCLRMQMQHTIHIMRAHNMPCHHSQDTHQQETTPTPPVDHPYTTRAPVLLRTTKLAQSTSQHYFVLRSLHKALPSTTLYYKACTNYFPVLCTTKLAKSTSQYYFVLQSLHKALPSTTLYYKACTNYFPVLLCTTKLAQSTSQYYFVLQSLHKLLPSTTLYYEACAKHFPVVLCTTKLAQNTFQYYFVPQSLHKESFYTQQVLSQRMKLSHTASFVNKLAQRNLLHTASSFAEKLLHTESLLNRETFTHRSFYTQ